MTRALVEALLLGRPGPPWRLHVEERADSSNTRLLEAVGSGGALDRPWTVLAVDEQSAGRGRHERRWECPRGAGLLVSLRLDLDLRRHALPLLGHWAALALATALGRRLAAAGLPARALWKWPNDLLLEDDVACGKVAGILVQTKVLGDAAVAVLGLGLNVAQRAFPEGLRQPARSLAQVGLETPREELLADWLLELGGRGLPEPGGALLGELRRVDLLATRPARLRTREGERPLGGHEHLEDGRLRLAWEGGSVILAGGGLRLEEITREGLWLSLED